jgi:hypothetical protein
VRGERRRKKKKNEENELSRWKRGNNDFEN